MRKNYKVPFRTRESIRLYTSRVRFVLGDSDSSAFKVTDFFRKLSTESILKTGIVGIEFFSPKGGETPAYVTYNPTKLHIDKDVWDEADIGEPRAKFIVGHELGHVLLHDHHAQQFSSEKSGIWKEEEDSEWQADTFSEELFVTEADVQNFVTPTNIANHCAVERDVVTRRLGKHLKYSGESCPSCGNFTLVRNGTCLKCDTCNWEVGM